MPVSAFIHRLKTGAFVGTLIQILTKKAYVCSKRIKGLKLCGFAGKMTMLTLLMFLMIGGVELNPGPFGYDDQLENVANRIQNSISGLEQKMMFRLNTIEDNQRSITENIKSLTLENRELKNDVQFLMEKCGYLENQSRRNNLVFDGIPRPYDRHESWEECEKIVCEVIYQGIGISNDVNIEIERAHRLNSRAIIAKFKCFKQKSLILSRAKNRRHSYRFSRVFVNEDFSERVKQKRAELSHVQRDLRQQGLRSTMRFDKLFSGDTVYTVDSDLRVHEGRRRGRLQDRLHDGYGYQDFTGSDNYGNHGVSYGGPSAESCPGMGDTGNGQRHGYYDDSHREQDISSHTQVSGVDVGSPQGQSFQASSNPSSGVGNVTPPGNILPLDTSRDSQRSSGNTRRPGSVGRARGVVKNTGLASDNQDATPLRGFGRGSPGSHSLGHGDRNSLPGQFDNAQTNSSALVARNDQIRDQNSTNQGTGINNDMHGGKTVNNFGKGTNSESRVTRSQSGTRQASLLDYGNMHATNK